MHRAQEGDVLLDLRSGHALRDAMHYGTTGPGPRRYDSSAYGDDGFTPATVLAKADRAVLPMALGILLAHELTALDHLPGGSGARG